MPCSGFNCTPFPKNENLKRSGKFNDLQLPVYPWVVWSCRVVGHRANVRVCGGKSGPDEDATYSIMVPSSACRHRDGPMFHQINKHRQVPGRGFQCILLINSRTSYNQDGNEQLPASAHLQVQHIRLNTIHGDESQCKWAKAIITFATGEWCHQSIFYHSLSTMRLRMSKILPRFH